MTRTILLAFFAPAFLLVSFFTFQNIISRANHSRILLECTGHHAGNIHIHATLTITQDGKAIEVPASVGITGDCIHPVHTHDVTGLIHMDYPKPIVFTLGDLFDTMGIVLTDTQIGSIKMSDGYTVVVTVNGQELHKFRTLALTENAEIRVTITSPKTPHS